MSLLQAQAFATGMTSPAGSFTKAAASEKALPVDDFLHELDAFIEAHSPYRQNKVIAAIDEGKASHVLQAPAAPQGSGVRGWPSRVAA